MTETRKCTKCEKDKKISDVVKESEFSRRKDGWQSWCKLCMKKANKRPKHVKKTKQRDYKRKHLYRLTPLEYDNLLSSQNGGCAICGSTEKLVIDHDHDTTEVRGILCQGCNNGLGRFGDSLTQVRKAFEYLERHYERGGGD